MNSVLIINMGAFLFFISLLIWLTRFYIKFLKADEVLMIRLNKRPAFIPLYKYGIPVIIIYFTFGAVVTFAMTIKIIHRILGT